MDHHDGIDSLAGEWLESESMLYDGDDPWSGDNSNCSKSMNSLIGGLFSMPGPDDVVESESNSIHLQPGRAELAAPQPGAEVESSNHQNSHVGIQSNRAIGNPSACVSIEPIPLSRPGFAPHVLPLDQYQAQQTPLVATSGCNSSVSEFLRIQQELTNQQLLQSGFPGSFATSLCGSQHMQLHLPCHAEAAASYPSGQTMIPSPWGVTTINSAALADWQARFAQGGVHPGNPPTSLFHPLSFAKPSATGGVMGIDQGNSTMEISIPSSPQVGVNLATISDAALADPGSPYSRKGLSEADVDESQESTDSKPDASKKSWPVVRPKMKDVCFALINQPGTKAWREKVDNLAQKIDLEWSDLVHLAVKRQLEAEGRRFLVCVKESNAERKTVKNKTWRTATDEEIMSKTKQRFRDKRKSPKNEIKKPRGRPPNRPRAPLPVQPPPVVVSQNSSTRRVQEVLFEAIGQCRQALEMARESNDANLLDRSRQARERLELLLPLNQLRWSHILESELVMQQQHQQLTATCQTEQEVLMLLDLQSETARKYDRIAKLKKAEVQIMNFIECLMENGRNELRAALDNVPDGGGEDDGNNGSDDDPDDDDGDESGGDGDDGPDQYARLRQATMESHPRKRGRGAQSSAADDPDFYQSDLVTVFQATPLAFTLKSGEACLLPPLDIDFEKRALADAVLEARHVGVRVDVEFDVATTDRLSAFLAKGECHVLHLSCHGHPEYLAMDNGWGGMHVLRVHELEQLIRIGAGNLDLVFLSSCCSRPAGEAFVAAGVPHVICCHHDQRPRDKVAIEFSRNFYRALACGKTVKSAFNLARHSLLVSSLASPWEAEKFILLPETPEDDDYHDVRIFSKRTRRSRGLTIPNTGVTRAFPCLPGNVRMNSLDVYHVLELLCNVDVVKITGDSGGRRLAAAVASFVRYRPHTMNLDDLFWFPPVVESDRASKMFRRVCDVLLSDSQMSTDKHMSQEAKYRFYFNEAMSYFFEKRCLFVINARRFKTVAQSSRLERFLCDILDDLHAKVVLVGCDEEALYSLLPRHGRVAVYDPKRKDPDTILENVQIHPMASKIAVGRDDDSCSELSDASVPSQVHFGTAIKPKEDLTSPSSRQQCSGANDIYSDNAKELLDEPTIEKCSKPSAAPQLGTLLEPTVLTKDVPDKGDSTKPVRTLDAFDATTIGTVSPSFVPASTDRDRISGNRRREAGQKASFSQGFGFDGSVRSRLYGRDKEISLLKDAYNRIALPDAPSEIVTVHGPSGTGKSTLVNHIQETLATDRSGIFVAGKFDELNARPYSAIVDAVSRLCHKFEGERVENIKRNLKQSLGSEIQVITELIPAVASLTSDQTTGEANFSFENEFSITRFKEIFRSFARAVSSPNHPIVLFLDDLQWADSASCALIDALASDPESKNILFVWAYRDDENGTLAPSPTINAVTRSPLKVSDIPVGAIDSLSLQEMVADVAQLSLDEVKPLCDLLIRRTDGIIHFVICFLQILEEQGFLVFSEELQRWEWDIEQIESQTVATENVAVILTARIARQSREVQLLLQLASCLGFFFDIELLEYVASSEGLLSEVRPSSTIQSWSYADPEEIDSGELCFSSDHGHKKFIRLLESARKERLIIQTRDPNRFKFAHDRIRQCVSEMIRNPDKRDELHLHIGMLIWNRKDSTAMDESSLFLAIDQLNRGSRYITDEDTKLMLAQLNLEAAGKAVRKSDYHFAARVLDYGIGLLNPRTMWEKGTYPLCLELHCKSAETENNRGNFDASDRRVEVILEHASDRREKLRAYYVQLDSLGVRRRMEDAITLGLKVLCQYGEQILENPSKISLLVEWSKTKRVLRGRRSHELLSLPEMRDEDKLAAMRLLNSIAFFAWHSERGELLTFVFLRMTRITLTHGLCKFSPFAFASFGMIFSVFGDLQTAYDFGNLARQLLDRARTKECHSSTQLLVYPFLEHLKKPLTLIANDLYESFQTGMETGQIHFACQCLSAMNGLNVVMGRKPLRSIILDTQRHRRIFTEYNQQFADVLTAPWHQFALNLTGQADDVKVLTGDAMNEAEFLSEHACTMAKVNLHFIRMSMLYILGDFEAASRELEIYESSSGKTEGSHFMAYFNAFFSGLICLAMAQTTKRRKYFVGARKSFNKIAKLARSALHYSPMWMLMQAVQKSVERGKRGMGEVREAFDVAIKACGQSGFSYMEAIASERAGEYMLLCGEVHEANTYLERARQVYFEWDAIAKVELLEKRHEKLRSANLTLPTPLAQLLVEEI